MEFKEMIKKACQVKNFTVFCLILLFLWWGSNAVVRYWSQPVSTDISYNYLEAKPGDQFPLITLCNFKKFYENPMFKECGDGTWNFTKTIVSCMKSNKRSKEADLMQNLHLEIGNLVEMVQFWTGTKYVNVQHLDEGIWTRVFDAILGPCYTFDLSKVDKLNKISIKPGTAGAGIEFVMAENNPWQRPELILHARFDLPDAFRLLGYLSLSFSDKTKEVHNVLLRKKITKKESTRKSPCVKYEYDTCESIENNEIIFKRFNCTIPILYSGPHLDNFIQKGASNCSYQVMLEALDFISKKESTNCFMAQTCENTRFSSKERVEGTWFENKTLVYITFENPEVEYRHSYISYDLISMIGEIGGLLGLTLGASVLTLIESLFKGFSCQRKRKNEVEKLRVAAAQCKKIGPERLNWPGSLTGISEGASGISK